MNRLLMTLAVLSAVATPALAQPSHSTFRKHSAIGLSQVSPAVHDEEGDLVGRDPDPNVRLQIYKDANSM